MLQYSVINGTVRKAFFKLDKNWIGQKGLFITWPHPRVNLEGV